MIKEELIKMIDCSEIQDNHEWKFGDRVKFKNRKGTYGKNNCIEQIQVIRESLEHPFYNKNDLLYIPTIEDWLEKLKNVECDILKYTCVKGGDVMYNIHYYDDNEECIIFIESCLLIALTRLYMYSVHNKEWNAESKTWEAK